MNNRIATDPRIDPRIKAVFGSLPVINALGENVAWAGSNVASREQLLAASNSKRAIAERQSALATFQAQIDIEAIAPAAGLSTKTFDFIAEPDGNTAKICFIRPASTEPLPCVYYIHGGGMATGSCFDPIYQVWGRTIASQGVAVALVDFRNCAMPSSVPEVAPFPAGLNDCVSGIRWLVKHASFLHIDPHRLIVAGESGGGNSG